MIFNYFQPLTTPLTPLMTLQNVIENFYTECFGDNQAIIVKNTHLCKNKVYGW